MANPANEGGVGDPPVEAAAVGVDDAIDAETGPDEGAVVVEVVPGMGYPTAA
jgi:hypothetical protein